MAQQTEELRQTAAASAKSTARAAGKSSKTVANRAAGEGQRVASRGLREAQGVASNASQRGQELVRTASMQSRELAGTVLERAQEVRRELSGQGQTLVDDARTQVETQTREQARRAAGTLTRLGNEAQALAEGRPEDAETVRGYVERAAETLTDTADRLYRVADDVEQRGIGGLASDLSNFARRRPGAFLLATAIAGFGVARVVRSSKSDAGDDHDEEQPTNGRTGVAPSGQAR